MVVGDSAMVMTAPAQRATRTSRGSSPRREGPRWQAARTFRHNGTPRRRRKKQQQQQQRRRAPPEDLLRRAYVPVAQLGHGPRDDVGPRQDRHPEASGRGGCHGQAKAGAGSARESRALCGGGRRLSRAGLPDGVLAVLAAHGALVAGVRDGVTTLPLRPALARQLFIGRNGHRAIPAHTAVALQPGFGACALGAR